MSRYASRYNKRDANDGEVVGALRRMGITCFEAGPLDYWCAFPEGFVPLEIKTKEGRLTKGQQEFVTYCAANRLPVLVLRSADEAIEAVMSRAVRYLKTQPQEIVYAKQVPQATPIHGDDRPRGKVSER